MGNIRMLDCTLRDGAYIVNGIFGESAIRGIIDKLQEAGVDMIECGWLKNSTHEIGTTYFHTPDDLQNYLMTKQSALHVAMIDWDRYDVSVLPECDHKSIDAIRVVFPVDKYREGIFVGEKIKEKGYQVFFQAANTLAYSDDELRNLAIEVNRVHPSGLSIVDTFGAMYEDDMKHIIDILDECVDQDIPLGFHSHNNQQMAFANSMCFCKCLENAERDIIIDSSLCGMGRGAGNATTELIANFLNKKYHHNYDMNVIMDAIDIYMTGFQEKYKWGYSTAYCIAGMYCCHVNNIAYLLDNHRTSARDMRNIIDSLDPEMRKKYDYDLLEEKYLENQGRKIDDHSAVEEIKKSLLDVNGNVRDILFIAPGRTSLTERERIMQFIIDRKPIVIGVNAILVGYEYDYLFITNSARYEYARNTYPQQFFSTKRILLSNIKKDGDEGEYVVNYSRAIKRGWPHFDNAVICALRLFERFHAKNIYLAGFDGFKNAYNESYADEYLPTLNPDGEWDKLNGEISEMYSEICQISAMNISFLTESIFARGILNEKR